MRTLAPVPLMLALFASPLLAQEEGGKTDLLSPNTGLMVWTLAIFVVLLLVLSRFAFKPLTAAVAAREQALADAIESAKRDREAAAQLLAEQRAQIEAARADAQRFIAEGRAAGEQMRNEMLEQTRAQQEEMLARARREIDSERVRAVADLRREAVDLAIAGAGRVIERNLDDQANRQLVESFLSSVSADGRDGGSPAR